MSGYEAHAFHDDFERGRASGNLTVSPEKIGFDGGGKSVSISIDGAEFKLGGASDRLLFMTHAEHPELTLYTSDLSILNDAVLRELPAIRQQLNAARRKRKFNWGVVALVAAILIGPPVALITNVDWVTGVVAKKIPAEWEVELGNSAFADFKDDRQMVEGETVVRLLGVLTQPLVAAATDDRYEYRIAIVDDDALNAFALPGGRIVINSGLIAAADGPDEVLGVVAHEIAHVTEQHGVRNIMTLAGTYVLVQALAGDVSGVLALLVNATPFLVSQSYSRGFETEADEKGVALLQRAAINSEGLITFLRRVHAEQEESTNSREGEITGEMADNALRYLSSHPATDERIAHLEALVAAQGAAQFQDFGDTFRELKLAVEKHTAARTEEKDEG